MWSKIIDPCISRRWFWRACTGCKLGPMLRSVEAQIFRVTTGPGKSWKVMGFRKTKFQAWIVMENNIGHGKSWKFMEKPWKGHGNARIMS